MNLRLRAAAALAGAAFCMAAATANAVPIVDGSVSSWNIGSGQTNDHFTGVTQVIAGGTVAVELGMRAQLRQIGSVAPVGSTYTFLAGPQTQPALNLTRAPWNFDISVVSSAAITDLDSLTLQITKTVNGVVTVANFNLLLPATRIAIDCHVGACANPAQPGHFYQASQNPMFEPWRSALNFDYNDGGTYVFRLTAVEGADTVSTEITVNVVPEPATILAFGAGLLGLAGLRRRRRA